MSIRWLNLVSKWDVDLARSGSGINQHCLCFMCIPDIHHTVKNHRLVISSLYKTFPFLLVRKPRRNNVLRRPPRPPVPIPQIQRNDIQQASIGAIQRQEFRRQIEARLRQAGLVIPRGSQSPVAKHKRLQKTSNKARSLGKKASKLVDASKALKERYGKGIPLLKVDNAEVPRRVISASAVQNS